MDLEGVRINLFPNMMQEAMDNDNGNNGNNNNNNNNNGNNNNDNNGSNNNNNDNLHADNKKRKDPPLHVRTVKIECSGGTLTIDDKEKIQNMINVSSYFEAALTKSFREGRDGTIIIQDRNLSVEQMETIVQLMCGGKVDFDYLFLGSITQHCNYFLCGGFTALHPFKPGEFMTEVEIAGEISLRQRYLSLVHDFARGNAWKMKSCSDFQLKGLAHYLQPLDMAKRDELLMDLLKVHILPVASTTDAYFDKPSLMLMAATHLAAPRTIQSHCFLFKGPQHLLVNQVLRTVMSHLGTPYAPAPYNVDDYRNYSFHLSLVNGCTATFIGKSKGSYVGVHESNLKCFAYKCMDTFEFVKCTRAEVGVIPLFYPRVRKCIVHSGKAWIAVEKPDPFHLRRFIKAVVHTQEEGVAEIFFNIEKGEFSVHDMKAIATIRNLSCLAHPDPEQSDKLAVRDPTHQLCIALNGGDCLPDANFYPTRDYQYDLEEGELKKVYVDV